VRIAWVFPATYVPRALSRSLRARDPAPPWQYPMLLSWTGIRGGLSLAAALAIPLTTRSGAPFPHRNMIIFLTFGVILTTLVLQGLTLPLLIRWLRLPADRTPEHEENQARARAAHAALARLEERAAREDIPPDMVEHLRKHYQLRIQRLTARAHGPAQGSREDRVAGYRALREELLAAERATIVELRDEGVIDDETMHRIERDLDLEEVRLGGARA